MSRIIALYLGVGVVNVNNTKVKGLFHLLSSLLLTVGMGGLSANASALPLEQESPASLSTLNAASGQDTSNTTLAQNSPSIDLSTYLASVEADAAHASALLPESSPEGVSLTSLEGAAPDRSHTVSAAYTLGVLDVAQADSATPGQSGPSGAGVLPSETTDPSTPATDNPAAQTAPSLEPTTPQSPLPTAPGTITSDTSSDDQPGTLPDTTPNTLPGSTPEPAPLESPSEPAPDTSTPSPAPTAPLGIEPGRATRTGSSYVGIGGNIGLGAGDTALGEGSFAVFSKVGLTPYLSLRPAVLVSDNPTILLPVTFDFIPILTGATEAVTEEVGFRASPYLGPGIAISTGDDGAVDFLLTGGVDIPITRQFTATAAVNASFFDNIAVGLLLGVGINF